MTSRRLLLLAAIVSLATAPAMADEIVVESDDDKAIYLLGLSWARQLGRLYPTEREAQIAAKAIVDFTNEQALDIDPQVYGPKLNSLAEARLEKGLAIEKEKSIAFLAQKGKESGAQVMPSGLVYIETQAGTGDQAKSTDTVSVGPSASSMRLRAVSSGIMSVSFRASGFVKARD